MTPYFPAEQGAATEFQGDAAAGQEAGSYRKLEIVAVSRARDRAVVECRWTTRIFGRPEAVRKASVTLGGGWASCDPAFLELPITKLFPLAPAVGRRWREGRWDFEVTDLAAAVYVGDDAGSPMLVKNCLEITFSFDEGGGRFYFAPKIGLVKAFSTDEQYAFSFVMTAREAGGARGKTAGR